MVTDKNKSREGGSQRCRSCASLAPGSEVGLRLGARRRRRTRNIVVHPFVVNLQIRGQCAKSDARCLRVFFKADCPSDNIVIAANPVIPVQIKFQNGFKVQINKESQAKDPETSMIVQPKADGAQSKTISRQQQRLFLEFRELQQRGRLNGDERVVNVHANHPRRPATFHGLRAIVHNGKVGDR